MSLRTKLSAGVLLGAICIGMNGAAVAGDVRQSVTTQATYATGSSEVHQIQSWLAVNAAIVNGETVGDLADLGEVTVTYKRKSGADVRANIIWPPPPTPLPGSGNPGDEFSITSTTQSSTQTWSYRWTVSRGVSQWTLIDYSYHVNTVPR